MTPGRHPARRRLRWFATRLILAVAVGILVAVAIDVVRVGDPGRWLAVHGIRSPYVPQGRVVTVDGRAVYIDCRGVGSPTVVFESGMGDGAGGWASVQDDVAVVTRACVHDRPGRGSSEPRGRHTLSDAATGLRRLLAAAGEQGPFIVVGHSLGGAYGRVFTGAYRDEVAGLILVDAFSPDGQEAAVQPLLGDLRTEYQVGLDGLRDLVARVEDLDWTTSEAQLRAADLRGVPIEVLRAPRFEPRLDGPANEAIETAVTAWYEGLSPGSVRYALAHGAGHMVQVDRPGLVIEAVLRLVDAARR
ncbi:MAG: alpha/beta hydrolase [Chloroflexota bacterium]